MRTREAILNDVIEIFEDCHANCYCCDCPLVKLCDEWDVLTNGAESAIINTEIKKEVKK